MNAFIEVDHSDGSQPFGDASQIFSVTEGSFVFGKDYEVFDALVAGREVWMAPEDKDPRNAPTFAPRGIPVPRSLTVAQHFFCLVADSKHPPNHRFWPKHRCITPATAHEWINSNGCQQSTVLQDFNCAGLDQSVYGNGEPMSPTVDTHGHIHWAIVVEPHYRNATWLNLREFEESLDHHGLKFDVIPIEYSILRDAMARLQSRVSQDRVRLVIGFG